MQIPSLSSEIASTKEPRGAGGGPPPRILGSKQIISQLDEMPHVSKKSTVFRANKFKLGKVT